VLRPAVCVLALAAAVGAEDDAGKGGAGAGVDPEGGAAGRRPLPQLLAEIERRFGDELPEPEPPPGLLAPDDTERHRRAAARYRKALEAWRRAAAERDRALEALCDAYLAREPESARVRRIRGTVRFRRGRLEAARADLEKAGPAGRDLLVECCRLLGDYSAALGHAGPDPDPALLEEAGRVEAAIAAAREAGLHEEAALWSRIGKACPEPIRGAPERYDMLVATGGGASLPAGIEKKLKDRFGKKIGFGLVIAEKPVIYLLDGDGSVLAVNPRPHSWTHRLQRFLDRKGGVPHR